MNSLAKRSLQTPSKGKRVGIVTNAGGPAILCTDACEAGGLTLPEFSTGVQERLRSFLPPAASIGNPVDMIASASPDHYRQTVETLLASKDIDALIVIYIPVDPTITAGVAAAIRTAVAQARSAGAVDKAVLLCLMGTADRGPGQEKLPTYAFPESAARVLSKAAAYADWRSQPNGVIPDFDDIDLAKARAICATAMAQRGGGWLSAPETRGVLEAMRLPAAGGGVATSAEEAVRLADQLGYPVAVKLASTKLVHKTEIGGVRLGLRDAAAVRRAFEEIAAHLKSIKQFEAMDGVLVQPMMKGGVEVMIGMTQDPLFGPLLAFGLGGIHVEILADVCFRITPLTDCDAAAMVRSIRGYRLLQGYRGHPPGDVPAIEDTLLRISRLVEEIPEIAELDLNPLFALPPGQGCRIVDARIRLAAT
jgi:acyl-CoA synthetase (NDP forming)